MITGYRNRRKVKSKPPCSLLIKMDGRRPPELKATRAADLVKKDFSNDFPYKYYDAG